MAHLDLPHLTYHLMQQLAVALPEQHTQIQNFGNVKEEIFIDNFSKHSWGDKVLLRVEQHTQLHRLYVVVLLL